MYSMLKYLIVSSSRVLLFATKYRNIATFNTNFPSHVVTFHLSTQLIVENEAMEDFSGNSMGETVETDADADAELLDSETPPINIQMPEFDDILKFQTPEYDGPGPALGNGMGLFVPVWMLVIVLIGFLGAMGYLIMRIFNSQRQHELDIQLKKQKKAERKAKAASKTVKGKVTKKIE